MIAYIPNCGTYAPPAVYRNRLGSTRWDALNGDLTNSDALYDPLGNDWYVCTIYGPRTSTFALFDPYCPCLPISIAPGSRAYNPVLGRWMSTRPYWFQDPSNPMGFNGYAYAGNDPIDNVDSGSGAGPTNPPLPGQDQEGGRNDMPGCSGSNLGCQAKDLHDLALHLHELEEPLINKVIGGGMMVAGAGTTGTALWLTFATGGAALPGTIPVMVGGTAMFTEGVYYEVTGHFLLPK